MNDFFNVTNNIDIVIKCIIIIFTQITCYKIINDNKYITISKCVGYATSIILSILMKFIEYKTDLFCSTIVLVFLMSFIFLFISKKKIGYSLILTIISLAINYVIYFISLIIAFLITNGIGNKKNDSVNVLIIVICNMIILILGFKNKKIKYGIISLQNNLNNEYIELLILTISVGILFIGIIFSNKIIVSINNYFCIFIILGILMLITIKKSLQLYYKQQMLIKDLKETKEVLENLGKKPCTTYKNEGGTGMGFMNTFDTLRKCNASLIIEELNEPKEDNYTKIVEIKFDKKNEFKVNSYKNKNR